MLLIGIVLIQRGDGQKGIDGFEKARQDEAPNPGWLSLAAKLEPLSLLITTVRISYCRSEAEKVPFGNGQRWSFVGPSGG